MAGKFYACFGLFLVFVMVFKPSYSAPRVERHVTCLTRNIEDETPRSNRPPCRAIYNITSGAFKTGVCLNPADCQENTFFVDGRKILAYCFPYDSTDISTVANAND
ncbi:uncharacterized protein LOC119574906 [Penaeus monodon]|uniref:uncharacterized protein LOC119574906 n=1 Tax=Penaeus monodon TaxID=6687 RepID=UPI0018A772C5|nr:uncharacterized protein LOC119574906 [Penaeus monodon]